MIRVARGQEPAKLPPIRSREIARVSQALQGDPSATPPVAEQPLSEALVGKQYQDVAEDLWRQQFHKCCYCEARIQLKFNDVEHYRPKVRACLAKDHRSNCVAGYWWLAWTWENLLFACPGCNRSGKNDQFPLDNPQQRLAPLAAPPGHETPLLLDPAAHGADPEHHLRFETRAGTDEGHLVGIDDLGKTTVRVCKLDRDDLVEVRAVELATLRASLKDRVESPLRAGDSAAALVAWQTLLGSWVGPSRPFAAMARAAMTAWREGLVPAERALLPAPPAKVW